MIKLTKIGNFLEEHVEKIILIIVGLVCAWLLVTQVILSPNQVTYDNNTYSPGNIDNKVNEDAEKMQQMLVATNEQAETYDSKVNDFLAVMDSPLRNINADLWPQRPYTITAKAGTEGIYRLPDIGQVTDVDIEQIRAVAYVPTERITQLNSYMQAGHEANDIDLVTVEAKFDIQSLYDSFERNFLQNVEQKYADPCLAKPTFASVQLQRQELLNDGSWSDWQVVPRSKIDSFSRLFSISENYEDLPPGGVKVQLLQFENKMVQIELLQPQAYQIASANEEWFPPSFHRKFLTLQRKDMLEERRIAKDTERQDNATDTERRRSSRGNTRTGAGATGGGGMYDNLGAQSLGGRGAGGNTGGRTRRSRNDASGYGNTSANARGGGRTADRSRSRTTDGGRTGGRDRTRGGATDSMMFEGGRDFYGGMGQGQGSLAVMEVYDEFREVQLNGTMDFSKLREPILFWAHDDTVEPKKTYRYKIRLGVFNPIAGTKQSRDPEMANKVILWTDFSDVTKPVEIPGTLYFFARDIQEAAKTVTVTVCKYVLGQWHKEDFDIRQGELIGNIVETEPEESETTQTAAARRTTTTSRSSRISTTATATETAPVPDEINYKTGAVMVDAVAVSDWTGGNSLRTRSYYEMLFSYDGTYIEHTPVGTGYWDDNMRTTYSYISRLQRETVEAFKPWGSRGMQGGRGGGEGDYPGMGGYDMMFNNPTTPYR